VQRGYLRGGSHDKNNYDSLFGESKMEAVRQIYHRLPATIDVPPELRDRRVEVIIFTIDDNQTIDLEQNLASGVADPYGAQFAGCLPDFPEREPQGEYEIREELDSAGLPV
jgi:hypothetical protein